MTGSVRSENRPAPHPSEMDKETLSSDDGARREGRITFATPSFSPREAMALRKHVIGIREKKKNGDDGDGVGDFLALEKDIGVVRRRGLFEREWILHPRLPPAVRHDDDADADSTGGESVRKTLNITRCEGTAEKQQGRNDTPNDDGWHLPPRRWVER